MLTRPSGQVSPLVEDPTADMQMWIVLGRGVPVPRDQLIALNIIQPVQIAGGAHMPALTLRGRERR